MKKIISMIICFSVLISCADKRETYKVEAANITESVYASGKVESKDQYQIMPKMAGLISKIHVIEGQEVKKGDLLFSISNDQILLQKEGAQLATQRSAFENNFEKIEELINAIEQADLKMKNDSIQLIRQKSLWAQNIGSKQDLDLRELSYKNSQAQWKSSQARLKDLRKSLEYQDRLSKNNLNISQASLSDFVIKADRDGRIYRLFKEVGELVGPNVPLAILGSTKDFLAILNVDERDVAKIQMDQKVYLDLESFPDQVFEAKVTKISPYLNERDKTFEVEASFIESPKILLPNQSFEANILVKEKSNAITIPRKFLTLEHEVFIQKNEKKKITTGLEDLDKVEVLEGLAIGDLIYLPK